MSQNQYIEIGELREGELVAVVTERQDTGHRAFRIAKEFKSRGELKQSSHLSQHHVESARRLLDKVEEFLER